jgi:hypothetical protein
LTESGLDSSARKPAGVTLDPPAVKAESSVIEVPPEPPSSIGSPLAS